MSLMSNSSRMVLSSIASHLIYPDRIMSSAFPRVRKVAAACDIKFDPWQSDLGMLMLSKRSDGQYACGISGVVLSIPRQTGKTFTVGTVIVLSCILETGLKVLWTAHRTRTSDETFRSMTKLVGSKKIKKYVKTVRKANGQQEIEFMNGSRILFGAREQGFGRGFDGVDIEVYDEAQILTDKALDDMLPATSVAQNPLILYMGTPPRPSDPGEVFMSKRDALIKGVDRDGLYLEFSADRDCDLDDRAQWRKANPSYPHRTSENSILRLRRQMSDDSFRRECLGVWDEATHSSVIPIDDWDVCVTDQPNIKGIRSYALDMNPLRTRISVGCAVKHEDGTAHVELVKYDLSETVTVPSLVEFFRKRWAKTAAVLVDAQSPAYEFVDALKSGGIRVTVTNTRDVSVASGRLLSMIKRHEITHTNREAQQPLYEAVEKATQRPLGNAGGFTWNRMDVDTDISPLMAVTLALHGSFTSKRRPGRKQEVMI